jgi:tetratricopeptide (TPR) repeat protein
MAPTSDKRRAAQLNEEGLLRYRRWEVEEAVRTFRQAAELEPDQSDYHLNLARALARFGDYEGTLRALGDFLRTESDPALTERFERLFGNAMDEVETLLTEVMTQHDLPLDVIGAAIQMWMEYRIAIGRRPLDTGNPEHWAAALDLTIRKVNFREAPLREIAEWYSTQPPIVRKYHMDLVKTLDVMPCDYRYFRGDQNPLDKLVEAAAMLEELEERFRKL